MLYGDATVKILLTLSVVGGCALAAVVGHLEEVPVDASQFNVLANVVLIAMFAATGWGLRTFAKRLLDKLDTLGKEVTTNTVELARVCATIEAREGQQTQIDSLVSDVADLRVDVARLQAVAWGDEPRATRSRQRGNKQ